MRKTTLLSIGVVRTLSKLVALPLLLLSLSSFSFGQGSSIYGQVIQPAPPTGTGGPAAFATVRICPFSGSGLPCTPLAPLFSDPTLITPVANPSTTDQYGNYSLFVATGTYIAQVTPVAGVTYSYLVFANGSATVSSVGLNLPPSIFSVTGSPVTSAGVLTGTLINQSANSVFAAPSGSVGIPIFRLLTPLDIPWATPGTIGSTTPNTGAFTTLSAATIGTPSLTINGGTPLTTTNRTGTGNLVLANAPTIVSPNLVTPSLGVATTKTLNNVRYCDQFPGTTADAQITAAIADLPAAGGTVDCRGYGATQQTIAAPLIVGSATKQVAMIIDRATQFNVTISNGADAIQLWVESAIVALDMGNVLAVGNFVVTPGANINNLIASYPRAGPSITNIRGITLVGNVAATVTGAMLDLVGVTDKSTVQETIAYNFNGVGLRIQNAAGGVPVGPLNITNISFNGSGLAGARPVLINSVAGGGVISGVNFFGGSITHPGPGGLAMVDIQGGAGNAINGVSFYGTQFESINTSDIGININNGLGITGSGLVFTSAGVNGTSCVKISQSGGVSYNLTFDNITNFNSWANTIQDTINTVSLTDPRIAHYTYLPPTANPSSSYSTAAGLVFGLSNRGLQNNAGGFKHQRFGASCTTSATAFSTCNNSPGYGWTTAFADSNYTVSCQGMGIASGVPVISSVIVSASQVVVGIANLTAVAAQFSGVDCIAVHDP
jgi:hypothetical protein